MLCLCDTEGRRFLGISLSKTEFRAAYLLPIAWMACLVPVFEPGSVRAEIARTLGVSAMTLHRWHKAPPEPQPALVATPEARGPDRARGADDRIAEFQLENSRLRRLVTDLLLEKIKLEETAKLSA